MDRLILLRTKTDKEMENKHTKGEWYFTSDGIYDGNGDQIANLTESKFRYLKERNENLANAKLIAASPMLLEALKSFVDYCYGTELQESDRFKKGIEAINKATL